MPDLVCYCFRVEKARIVAAIEDGCASVDDLSARLRVCTGCGGCRPDLEDLLRFYGDGEDGARRAPPRGPLDGVRESEGRLRPEPNPLDAAAARLPEKK